MSDELNSDQLKRAAQKFAAPKKKVRVAPSIVLKDKSLVLAIKQNGGTEWMKEVLMEALVSKLEPNRFPKLLDSFIEKNYNQEEKIAYLVLDLISRLRKAQSLSENIVISTVLSELKEIYNLVMEKSLNKQLNEHEQGLVFGDWLKKLIQLNNNTIEDFSRQLGIHKTTVDSWFNGKLPNEGNRVKLENLAKQENFPMFDWKVFEQESFFSNLDKLY